ncbi:hypothetical protein Rsub_11093 [Raphidocelis subcapitata]|uniref:SWIM-type domain-containing protein n=1 Tax=Raphidocelis subcapitata TaxID=307507 RepID=A0A2V0PF23_9CHLO|nr:hypothetical protein Rsub_11093 [Raphidocelis subcapitata]|eukprot:GBF98448.1 hypothetical protein Rsub_11093 [Raphidocelis subcapitata]
MEAGPPTGPDEAGGDYLTPLELQRAQLIARNRERLIALGLPEAVSGLRSVLPQKPARKPRPPHAKAPAPSEPTRRSSRVEEKEAQAQAHAEARAAAAEGRLPAGVEEGTELADFIQKGECPRCGAESSDYDLQQHHLAACRGPPEPPTEEQLRKKAKTEVERMKELELGGLVDYVIDGEGPGARARATFIVVGSRGNHYAIKLDSEPPEDGKKRSCECPDHRIRKRDCKHIKLVMQQLGVGGALDSWPEALSQQVSEVAGADEEDVERVHSQERRREERAAGARRAAQHEAAAEEGEGEGEGEEEEEEEEEEEQQPKQKRGARGKKRARR